NQAAFNFLAMRQGTGFMPLMAARLGSGFPYSGSYGGMYGGMYGNMYGYGGYGSGYGGSGYGGSGYGSGANSYGDNYAGYSSPDGNPYQSGNYGNSYMGSSMENAGSHELKTGRPETAGNLARLGVPSADSRLDWPLGLRILPPGEKAGELRQQIDGLFQQVASR